MTRRPGRVASDRPGPFVRTERTAPGRLLAVLLVASLAAGCDREAALLRQPQKAALVQTLVAELLASVEAEKSAVMAMTDEESAKFAAESRRRTTELTRLRDDLHRRVVEDDRPGEVEKLTAFDAAWAGLRDVDERLLTLAVANSNLKAARLAAGEGAVAVDRVVDALADVQARTVDPGLLRRLSAGSAAALRIQTLLAPHIASADDAEMTRIEQRIQALGAEVTVALAEAQSPAATAAWADYSRLTADVIRLSRENTNVVSVDVSLHEKRQVTESCRAALVALLAEIQSVPTPTR